MTKKDYILIARYIKNANHNDANDVIHAVAKALEAGYSGSYSFKYNTFIEACGVKERACV